jgi:hypothetical protein
MATSGNAELDGKGSQARNIRLHEPEAYDDPDVQGFIAQALAKAIPPVSHGETGGIVIKSVSTKQRPRRLVLYRSERLRHVVGAAHAVTFQAVDVRL